MTPLKKYIAENNLLDGIPSEHHEAYKRDVEQSLGFAFYLLRYQFREFLDTLIKLKIGTTRIVIVAFGYAFKIPNFTHCHAHFLKGCYGNYRERELTKFWKSCEDCGLYEKINPTLFTLFFGLISIQKECKPLSMDYDNYLLQYVFGEITQDLKPPNFGINRSGSIVCLDYAD